MEFSYLQILIFGVVQGLAELLPVSSSAHVILAARLMDIKDTSTPQFVFLVVMLHTGTMFAAIVYFWRRWLLLLQPSVGEARLGVRVNWNIIKMLLVATALTGILGYGLKKVIEKVILESILHYPKGEVESLWRNLPLIGISLALVGCVMLLADFLESNGPPHPLTMATSVWIGLIQGLCLPFRGFSRSGATISMGMFRGLDRRLAEEFSFALGVLLTPAIIVYSLLGLRKHSESGETAAAAMPPLDLHQMLVPGLLGMVFSFLAGLVALKLLSVVLESGRWRYFGVYCLFAAGVMFFAAYQGL